MSYIKKINLKITEEKDISELIIEEQNKLLGSIPKEEDIFKAIWSLGGVKSPWIDGFPMFFFVDWI